MKCHSPRFFRKVTKENRPVIRIAIREIGQAILRFSPISSSHMVEVDSLIRLEKSNNLTLIDQSKPIKTTQTPIILKDFKDPILIT